MYNFMMNLLIVFCLVYIICAGIIFVCFLVTSSYSWQSNLGRFFYKRQFIANYSFGLVKYLFFPFVFAALFIMVEATNVNEHDNLHPLRPEVCVGAAHWISNYSNAP
ncbi:hypothetical protein ACX1I2_21705 [Yersinia enterocolitica]